MQVEGREGAARGCLSLPPGEEARVWLICVIIRSPAPQSGADPMSLQDKLENRNTALVFLFFFKTNLFYFTFKSLFVRVLQTPDLFPPGSSSARFLPPAGLCHPTVCVLWGCMYASRIFGWSLPASPSPLPSEIRSL